MAEDRTIVVDDDELVTVCARGRPMQVYVYYMADTDLYHVRIEKSGADEDDPDLGHIRIDMDCNITVVAIRR